MKTWSLLVLHQFLHLAFSALHLLAAAELAGQSCAQARESECGLLAAVTAEFMSETASVTSFHIRKFQDPLTGSCEPALVEKVYSSARICPEGTNVMFRTLSTP